MSGSQKKGGTAGRIPSATYRLQFGNGFGFREATGILDYLDRLGISDVYASPLFKTASNSTHGYEVCDYNQLNPSLGTPEDFEVFSAKLKSLGMGLLLDIVPNHMRADVSNAWWKDVLEKGRASRFAEFFDINWEPIQTELRNKVLLPVLGEDAAAVIKAGQLQLGMEGGEFFLKYYDNTFPLAVESYVTLLDQLLERLPPDGHAAAELKTLITNRKRQSELGADFDKFKNQLQNATQGFAEISAALQFVLSEFNGAVDQSYGRLEELLREQHYVLHYWKTGLEKINYRRFFDVSDLVCINVQREEVFERSHRFLSCLCREGKVTGLRVDHPDGLWDPKEYFNRLQASCSAQPPSGIELSSADAPEKNFYIVAEKILSGDEALPSDWAVDGTTGYDFLIQVNSVFIDTRSAPAFSQLYKNITGIDDGFETVARSSKKRVLQKSFASELQALTNRVQKLASACCLELGANEIHEALIEIITNFPVYRTYITASSTAPSDNDRSVILQTDDAIRREQTIPSATLQFIVNLLLLDLDKQPEAMRQLTREFVMRFQQLSGPATAKGIEDTAFYIYNRFVSLNEVGGAPEKFGITVKAFHSFNEARQKAWPRSLNATATHDTKRGEDVRARLNVLSEMPEQWRESVRLWMELNNGTKITVDGTAFPDANDEYLLYQTLIGVWPTTWNEKTLTELTERVQGYMLKAIRESKRHTTWTEQNEVYEKAVMSFVEGILKDETNGFLKSFSDFQKTVSFFGQFNSYAQMVLKATAPGVPDFYQGTELWDFSLVDPDNRRSVDYSVRQRILAEVEAATVNRETFEEWMNDYGQGRMKAFLTQRMLKFRRDRPRLFTEGGYEALELSGTRASHGVAFLRKLSDQQVLVLVPRLPWTLTGGKQLTPVGEEIWRDTVVKIPIDARRKRQNIFTGETIDAAGDVPVSRLLNICPVGVFIA